MKKILTFASAVVVFFTLASWTTFGYDSQTVEPDRNITTRNVTASGFTNLSASRSANVVYRVSSSKEGVEVSAPANYQEFVVVKKEGSTLSVSIEAESKRIKSDLITVNVYGRNVDNFTATKSADIKIKSAITCPTLNFTAESSGDIEAQAVTCNVAYINAKSSGDIEVGNLTVNDNAAANIAAESSGDIEIKRLNAFTANVVAQSSADIEIGLLKATTANLSARSSGEISAEGSCTQANLEASSSGEIKAGKLHAQKGTMQASSSSSIRCNVASVISSQKSSGGSITNMH